jgi:hypothetical protein
MHNRQPQTYCRLSGRALFQGSRLRHQPVHLLPQPDVYQRLRADIACPGHLRDIQHQFRLDCHHTPPRRWLERHLDFVGLVVLVRQTVGIPEVRHFF